LLACATTRAPVPGPLRNLHQWIYVAGVASAIPQIRVYPLTANGAVSPDHIIAGSHTGLTGLINAMALDRYRNLYVLNGGGINEYGPDASGDVAPIRTIRGSNTGLGVGLHQDLVVDSCGDIYVLISYYNTPPVPDSGSILEFASSQSGNVAPVAVLFDHDPRMSAPYAMAQWGSLVAVSQTDSSTVTFLNRFGDAVPAYTLGGGRTTLSHPYGVAIDAKGALYVANSVPPPYGEALVFPSDAQTGGPVGGDTVPSRILTFPAQATVGRIAVDTEGNLYALSTNFKTDLTPGGSSLPFLYVYGPTANGNDPPSATLWDPGITLAFGLLVEDAVTTGDVPAHPAQVGRSISRAAGVLGPSARC
jgi:hypothetical protein